MASLGELERAVMDLLWAGQGSGYGQHPEGPAGPNVGGAGRLRPRGPRNLPSPPCLRCFPGWKKKGLVERRRGTRPHRYQAVSSRADHTAELMRGLVSAPDREACWRAL